MLHAVQLGSVGKTPTEVKKVGFRKEETVHKPDDACVGGRKLYILVTDCRETTNKS